MGYKFRFRKGFKSPFGLFTLTNRGVTHSVRTPLGTFSNRILGGSSSGGGAASGCLTILGTCILLLLLMCGGFVTFAIFAVPRKPIAAKKTESVKTPVVQTPVVQTPVPEVVESKPEPVPIAEPIPEVAVPKAEPVASRVEPVISVRRWSDAAGKYSVDAILVSVTEGKVTLQRSDNQKEVSIPIDKLSEADRIYLEYENASRSNPKVELLIGKVVSVLDGDTIKINDLRLGDKILRLSGIDAPETGQSFAKESKQWLMRLLLNQKVRAEVVGKDSYGRPLSNVFMKDLWVNLEIVHVGMAWHYLGQDTDKRLSQAEIEAKKRKLGLWHEASQIAPWDFRNGVRDYSPEPATAPVAKEEEPVVYVTDSGEKYHSKGCRHLDKSSYAMPLSRARSAYERCKVCNP